jgi:hypothetical protein
MIKTVKTKETALNDKKRFKRKIKIIDLKIKTMDSKTSPTTPNLTQISNLRREVCLIEAKFLIEEAILWRAPTVTTTLMRSNKLTSIIKLKILERLSLCSKSWISQNQSSGACTNEKRPK